MGFLDKLLKSALNQVERAVNEATEDNNRQTRQENAGNNGQTYRAASAKTTSNRVNLEREMMNLLADHFPEYDLRMEVSPSIFNADPMSRSYSYGLYRNGSPKMMIMVTEHNRDNNRAYRYAKQACENAGVPFLNFFTHMPNEKEYVINRIKNAL